jgi:hypothetical protein
MEAAMFCPQCKAEYRVGFTRCSDCDVALVDHLAVKQRTRDPFAPEPVVIRTYSSGPEADLAKGLLEGAGIESMIRGEAARHYYHGLAFSPGIELLVRAEDAEEADEILDSEAADPGS